MTSLKSNDTEKMPFDQPMATEAPSYSRRRPAVVIEHGNLREEIDTNIAPLILEIWKSGIQTTMSCQETDLGIAWIEFDSTEDLSRCLNIVTRYEAGADTLYNRVNRELVGERLPPHWEYQVRSLG